MDNQVQSLNNHLSKLVKPMNDKQYNNAFETPFVNLAYDCWENGVYIYYIDEDLSIISECLVDDFNNDVHASKYKDIDDYVNAVIDTVYKYHGYYIACLCNRDKYLK